MSRVTRFATRDGGPSDRMAGFIAHLRGNGLRLGVGETETALHVLGLLHDLRPETLRLALKPVCVGCAEEGDRFDELFDSYWLDAGRVRTRLAPSASEKARHTRSSAEVAGHADQDGTPVAPDDGAAEGTTDGEGSGKLIAARMRNMMRKDLRELVTAEDIDAAERVAITLGRALADRRSRRRKAACKGSRIDLRRAMRKSLATGGEPLHLPRRQRPDRPTRITVLCDVSGSMALYSRIFLAFLSGLMRADRTADAYLFHTRLVRITEALRDDDPLRALGKVTLLADGFGGGSRIAANLDQFAGGYARRFVSGRHVVFILSDGCDTDPPEAMSAALTRLKRRGCRIVWLNPLKGWADYEPIVQGMAAALPHLDLFAPANTLNDLAALEKELMRL